MTNRLHIVGGKNHGKTGLIVQLVGEFTRRGRRVGTVKHTSHEHELDTPGKDSHQHRTAGAVASAIIAPSLYAVYLPVDKDRLPARSQAYSVLAPLFAECDLVLVEGDLSSGMPCLEVWRAAREMEPLAASRSGIVAVVSDDRPAVAVPILPRSDVAALADWLERQPWFGR
jgi:molybdopterin-guanine dinucleotide biosynthesis protein B